MTSLSLIAELTLQPRARSERKLQRVLTVATGGVRTAQQRHELLIIETQPVARRRAPTWKGTPSGGRGVPVDMRQYLDTSTEHPLGTGRVFRSC